MSKGEILKRIPEREQFIYKTMTELQLSDKELLWHLIKQSNKENVAIYDDTLSKLRPLLDQQLIHLNQSYKPSTNEVSLFILNRAPYLMRVLKREYL
ncbi:hypothetical protein [Aquisalibacillus elongatus]|uniref:hypothetical protein n=1 Tax=Aquisalibacillus elongatus TaxID=485577 RepID=UPI000F541977|nr:hypothetical protein [Aquisalibacillus elongatus]